MRQIEGMVMVWIKRAVPKKNARVGIGFLFFLQALISATLVAAESAPLERAKPSASVAPPTISKLKAAEPVKQDPAACAPSTDPARAGSTLGSDAVSPETPANVNNEHASSSQANDLAVKLPHEQLDKDEIRVPTDAQPGAGDSNQNADADKGKLQVSLKETDEKDGEPASAAGSPAQCTLPSATQSAGGSPTPH